MKQRAMESVYDRALIEIGSNSRFQKQYDVIYNVGLVLIWSMVYTNIILCLTVVPHTCKILGKTENISEFDWKQEYIPTYLDVAGEIKFDSCSMYSTPDSNKTKECDQFNYDKTWYEATVSSENDWVCSKELYVANILGFSKIGESIGSIFFGWLGDVWGRRPTLLLSLLMIIVGRFMSLIAKQSYILFLIGCIIAALPSWSVPQSASLVSFEISSSSRRTVITTLRFASYSIGMALMALLFWWLRDWKLVLIVTTVPLIPYLIVSWTIIESPQWLHSKGRNKECIKKLKAIAKKNKTKLHEDTETELLATVPAVIQKVSPLVLFAGRRLAMNTILQILLWAGVSLNYTVLVLRAGEKSDGNPFTEFAWQCVVEVPSNFIGAWLADHIGRRRTSVMSNGITAAVWIVLLIRDTTTISWIRHWLVGSIVVIIGRLTIFISYYALSLFCIELYPTCLRQSGMAFGNIVSSFASAVAPYVLYLSRMYDVRVPGIVLTIACIVGVASSLLLPETLNAKLPETLEEAQNFGKKEKKYDTIDVKLKETLQPLKE